jgi:hypothetical protein
MIAGRDAERGSAVREQIAKLGLENAVHLLGFRTDVENILAASDVFVLPTLSDPLPLVVQEAMSVGTPVIATRSGGCSDMVVHGATGLLVAVSDPDELANAIIALMNDPEQRAEMGRRGRDRLSAEFSHHEYIRRMSGVFTELAGMQPPATVRLAASDFLKILFDLLDVSARNFRLEQMNTSLVQTSNAVEHAFSTRLGRTLTSPWRGIRRLLGR